MLFDLGWSEILLVGVVALVFIGPKDLPKALRVAGFWVRKARTLSREFQSSIDQMIRESELDEMRQGFKKASEFDLEQEFHNTIEPPANPAGRSNPAELAGPPQAEGTPFAEASGAVEAASTPATAAAAPHSAAADGTSAATAAPEPGRAAPAAEEPGSAASAVAQDVVPPRP